jgi:hypothetical protein
MTQLSISKFILEIRELDDPESESGKAWFIDVLDPNGELLIDGAGVASRLASALTETGQGIAYLLDEAWNMPKAEGEGASNEPIKI